MYSISSIKSAYLSSDENAREDALVHRIAGKIDYPIETGSIERVYFVSFTFSDGIATIVSLGGGEPTSNAIVAITAGDAVDVTNFLVDSDGEFDTYQKLLLAVAQTIAHGILS